MKPPSEPDQFDWAAHIEAVAADRICDLPG
jgi:hypothetical protein